MTIPIIHGIAAARAKIARQRTLADKIVAPETAQRIEKLFGEALTPEQAVSRILDDVRTCGDEAVRAWTNKIDGIALDSFQVSAEEIETAYQETPAAVREALHLAADRIRAFHEKQFTRLYPPDRPTNKQGLSTRAWFDEMGEGALGQIIRPLERVGIYVPGGSAPLPSSLLMASIPAHVAGVSEIIVTSPASRGGKIAPVILAAARVAGVSSIFALGGAQAIGALAFGTETVRRVDKILGAGGLFTTLAKRQVFGVVGIEGLYGPTETMLIADDSANPRYVAADLLAQAEHDVLATSILLTDSVELAEYVQVQVEWQLEFLSRRAIIERSLEGQGAILVLASLDECVELANTFAPEHLCLLTRDAWSLVPKVRNAGGVFVGEQSPEALGDYMLGPSHLMPTGGTARFASPLNVNDFLKITSVFYANETEAKRLNAAGQILANGEELTAHANALKVRTAEKE
ncbi:MAG TPA: histidinol dehydrogenase [Anaerolineae bacterium]|nr:histidinol dehydrogenase [Anaerolineae bacterium]